MHNSPYDSSTTGVLSRPWRLNVELTSLTYSQREDILAHVFISYLRENRDTIDRLANELRNRGVTVWLDRNNIDPGARWRDAIRKAIQSGNFFLACFSKEY